MVIGNPVLVPIAREIGNLGTIASCTQELAHQGYGERFAEYDKVVLLNQDTTPEVVERLQGFSDQIIVFLSLPCNNPDRGKCLNHLTYDDLSLRELGLIKSKVEGEYDPEQMHIVRKECFDIQMRLLSRHDDLKRILELGVRNFKIARNISFFSTLDFDLEMLFSIYNEVREDEAIPV